MGSNPTGLHTVTTKSHPAELPLGFVEAVPAHLVNAIADAKHLVEVGGNHRVTADLWNSRGHHQTVNNTAELAAHTETGWHCTYRDLSYPLVNTTQTRLGSS